MKYGYQKVIKMNLYRGIERLKEESYCKSKKWIWNYKEDDTI
jgi:hypothetical protein